MNEDFTELQQEFAQYMIDLLEESRDDLNNDDEEGYDIFGDSGFLFMQIVTCSEDCPHDWTSMNAEEYREAVMYVVDLFVDKYYTPEEYEEEMDE